MKPNKKETLRNVKGVICNTVTKVKGYEIHAGISVAHEDYAPLFSVANINDVVLI